MQDNKSCDGKELICINVDKVYDWIVKEKSFDFSLPSGDYQTTPALPPNTNFTNAVVTCEVKPYSASPIVIISREDRHFCIDGKNVILQLLNIRKYFVVSFVITLADGTRYTVNDQYPENPALRFSRNEQVTMCAPLETDVAVTYTSLDCFINSQGSLRNGATGRVHIEGLTLSINSCQSIQSTFPVTVEFLAEFCEPRADIVASCSPPSRPQQCPVVFPDGGGHCCD